MASCASSPFSAVHTIKPEIAKPESDTEFEAMCANIYGAVHGDTSPKRNGRSGQKQAGVDVFIQTTIGRIGIQSKRYQDGKLAFKHIEQEVRRADNGKAPIVKLIIATTAASDASLIRKVQELSDQRVAAGLFPVEIDFWSEICSYIDRHNVLQDHYSPLAPGAAFHRAESAHAAHQATLQQVLTIVTQMQSAQGQASLPSGRDDSVNRLITNQLDGVNGMLKAARYREAADLLELTGKDFGALDAHQKARWHVQRGVCRIHLHGGDGAAEDFLAAAALYPADEKMAAAKIRGLMIQTKTEEALAAGADAIADFPASVQVWVAYAHAKLAANQSITEADVPPGMANDPDVMQLLCWAAWQRNDYPVAVAYGRRLIDDPAAGFYSRAAALTAALSLATADPVARTYRLIDQGALDTLHEVVRSFEPRAEKLWCNQSRATLPDDTANLAYAYMLLGQPTTALQVLDECATHVEVTPRLLSVRFEALRELDRIDEFIALAKAQTADIEPGAIMVVADTAAAAGEVDLVDALIARASELTDRDHAAALPAMRWIAMFRDEAVKAIMEANIGAEQSSPVLMTAIRTLLAAGRKTDAAIQLDRLTTLIPGDAPAGHRLMLADLMYLAGRHAEAAELYAPFAVPGRHSDLHKKLLRSYIRSGQRRRAKDLLDSFPAAWSHDDETRNYAIELANAAGDWHRLLPLAMIELRQSPGHAAPWQLRLAAEVRTASAGDFSAVLADVPAELEGSVRQVVQMASLEIRYGSVEKGMMRLYRLFRRNMEDPDAAVGYMMVMLMGPEGLPWMEVTLPTAVPGCSCCLEDERGQQIHLTIDPEAAGDLPRSTEFVRSADDRARDLIGKAVGEEVVLTATFNVKRRFKLLSITTAFRRLLHITFERANSPVGGLPHVLSVQVVKENGELDLGEMHGMIKRSGDRSRLIFETYEKQGMTLGMCATALSTSPLELVLGWPQDGPPMKVCAGEEPERSAALAALRVAEAVVLDLATLGEIVALGCEAALGSIGKVYISTVSQQALRDLSSDAANDRRSANAVDHHGRLHVYEYTEQYKSQRTGFLARVQDAIDTYCEVCPAYGAQDLPPRFAQLEDRIGDEEYEALLLAHERKALLLSVDLQVRTIAKAMLGIDGAWLQPLFMHAAEKGNIDPRTYSSAVAAMFLGNRTHVSVNAQNLLWMCQQGDTSLQDALDHVREEFSAPQSEFSSSLQVAQEFISLIVRLGPQFGVVLEIMEYLYEALFRHPACPDDFEAIVQWYLSDLIETLDVPRSVSRRWMSLLMRRVKAAQERAGQPPDARPVMLSVIKVTRQPTIVLRPEIVKKHEEHTEQPGATQRRDVKAA